MIRQPRLFIDQFDYQLPEEKIAQYPLEQRDMSKILLWKDGDISTDIFRNLAGHLPEYCLMIFNDTRVIRARLLFRKPTGGVVEIFCLEPDNEAGDPEFSMNNRGTSSWKCLVGNARRWKNGKVSLEMDVQGVRIQVTAEITGRFGDGCFGIRFSWEPEKLTFREVLDYAGSVPLPPYILRPADRDDDIHYQTIFASHEGSVAAPTAGLHFTERVLGDLRKKRIETERVTLHVGLGTFRPVSENDVSRHLMHGERIMISLEAIRSLINHPDKPVIAVGTTSVRTIESLYWAGVRLITNPAAGLTGVDQWDPYDDRYDLAIPAVTALEKLADELAKTHSTHYHGITRLMIVPGYRFRIIGGMVTNFHLPKSTLLLLVSAFAGESWKTAYGFALENGFRFLSYGDASLFLKTKI